MRRNNGPGIFRRYLLWMGATLLCAAAVLVWIARTHPAQLERFLYFLNTYGSGIQATAAVLALFVSILFGVAVFEQVEIARQTIAETQEDRRHAVRPLVSPTGAFTGPQTQQVRGKTWRIRGIKVCNLGTGPALDLRAWVYDVQQNICYAGYGDVLASNQEGELFVQADDTALSPAIRERVEAMWAEARRRLVVNLPDGPLVCLEVMSRDAFDNNHITRAFWTTSDGWVGIRFAKGASEDELLRRMTNEPRPPGPET